MSNVAAKVLKRKIRQLQEIKAKLAQDRAAKYPTEIDGEGQVDPKSFIGEGESETEEDEGEVLEKQQNNVATEGHFSAKKKKKNKIKREEDEERVTEEQQSNAIDEGKRKKKKRKKEEGVEEEEEEQHTTNIANEVQQKKKKNKKEPVEDEEEVEEEQQNVKKKKESIEGEKKKHEEQHNVTHEGEKKPKKKRRREEGDEGEELQGGHSEVDPVQPPASQQKPNSEIMSSDTFESITLKDGSKISEKTLRAIREMGLKTMTQIQALTLPLLLEVKNVLGTAKTGSGKTLAFLIEAVELLAFLGYKPRNGTGAIILSPTRELAIQTYSVLQQLLKYHSQNCALLMGGAKRKVEAEKLYWGVSIVVTTPGRLLDHMLNTEGFHYKRNVVLVIDEADMMMEVGFAEELKQIVDLLPEIRQDILFSATLNQKTQDCANIVFRKRFYLCRTNQALPSPNRQMTVTGLQQSITICPWERRLEVFTRVVIGLRRSKVMVFFNSCASVEFHARLLISLSCPGVMRIHGKQKQSDRSRTFFKFNKVKSGILLCTNVAARGWDVPQVDWIIQFDPPDDVTEYVHRVGRAARGEGGTGKATVFLAEPELHFVRFFRELNVECKHLPLVWRTFDKYPETQQWLESVVWDNYLLRKLAKEAYEGFIKSYGSHRSKTVFNINNLDPKKICTAFGFKKPPRDVNLGNIKLRDF